MAKDNDSKNASSPMISGSKKGVIETPMNATNAGKSSSGPTHDYKGMPSPKGSVSVAGPGEKGAWTPSKKA